MSDTVDSLSDIALSSAIQQPMLYRCTCSVEFAVDPQWGGICPSCQRRVDAVALRIASSATMTLQNLDADKQSLDFVSSHIELAEGTMLGHFRLENPIGKGGMGAVYRALDTSLERYVAVKVMRPGDGDNPEQIESMLREAVAQARLNHPNVVTIYFVGRHKDEPFLAMELVDGETLADQIKQTSLDYSSAIRIALEVTAALAHAEHFGIVHADIKPSNLLVARDGQTKLSDFGLARLATSDGDTRPIAGTPAYIAPELLDGKPVSVQSDMYALGVVLFEMVFGRYPFSLSGSTLRTQLLSHKTATIEFPSPWPATIPASFARLIERLMAKEPTDRFIDYDELARDLKKIQPLATTIAGISARAMAYAIDQALLLLGFAPFALVIYILETVDVDHVAFVPMVALFSLCVPLIYLVQMRKGVSSLGRYLFQLRICEENGLPPGREQLLTREILRSMLAWMLPLGAYFSLYYPPSLLVALEAVALILAAEVACLLFSKHRRTLHDFLCRSRVVLRVEPDSK